MCKKYTKIFFSYWLAHKYRIFLHIITNYFKEICENSHFLPALHTAQSQKVENNKSAFFASKILNK